MIVASALFIFVFSSCKKDISVSDVNLDETFAVLIPGENLTLTATVFPEDATDKNLIWSSSDDEVATVVNGVVTAGIKEGTADISVKVGGKEAICSVTVTSMQMILTSQDPNYIGIELDGANNVAIDWGDGTIVYRSISSSGINVVNAYSQAGTYTVKITGSHIMALFCSNNRLTHLDVSKNPNLERLECFNNELTSLDVSKNTALTVLYCNGNRMTSLDVSNNTELMDLSCRDNQLTNLNVSRLSKLSTLRCFNNLLTTLDLSGLSALWRLWCENNLLEELDLSDSPGLSDLNCNLNLFQSLDLSANQQIVSLSVERNRLTSLTGLSENQVLSNVNCAINNLSDTEINNLFEMLHSNPISGGKNINVRYNTGSSTCNPSIASNKGWTVTVN